MALYRILVVDDEIETTLPVLATLQKAGYEVATAKDGWDGLAQARRLKPDLVLLDVKMPAMDGWTFMKFVRAHQDLAAIPVVFLTASDVPGDRDRGLKLGAAGYLTKPVDAERLLIEVASVLDRRAEPRGEDGSPSAEKTKLRMSGRIDQMGLLALFSILGAGQRTGVLEIRRGPAGDRGRVLLRQGRVASARVEGLRRATGLDAVEVLGKWKDGAFTFVEEEVLIGEDATASVPRV
ncbi:MAG: response regulator [Planctomycetaceae bacterium]|nr:response regulator [Planctomycetaceae bacterium]